MGQGAGVRTTFAVLTLAPTLMLAACAEGENGPPLEAAFSAEFDHITTGPTSCPVTAIQFTDETTGGPTEWDWQLEDAATSDDQNPTWETNRIVAEVTLTVRRGDVEDSVTKLINTVEC